MYISLVIVEKKEDIERKQQSLILKLKKDKIQNTHIGMDIMYTENLVRFIALDTFQKEHVLSLEHVDDVLFVGSPQSNRRFNVIMNLIKEKKNG